MKGKSLMVVYNTETFNTNSFGSNMFSKEAHVELLPLDIHSRRLNNLSM